VGRIFYTPLIVQQTKCLQKGLVRDREKKKKSLFSFKYKKEKMAPTIHTQSQGGATLLLGIQVTGRT
jgi:hypothetical protein